MARGFFKELKAVAVANGRWGTYVRGTANGEYLVPDNLKEVYMGLVTLKRSDADIIYARQTHFKATGLRAEDVALALGSRIVFETNGDCILDFVVDGNRQFIQLGAFKPERPANGEDCESLEVDYGVEANPEHWHYVVAHRIADRLDCNMHHAVVTLMLLQAHAKASGWELQIRTS